MTPLFPKQDLEDQIRMRKARMWAIKRKKDERKNFERKIEIEKNKV